jgi:predicted dehydrogenase
VSPATSARPLRVAIVGAGLMGGWHARYALRAGAEIAAIVDRDPSALARLGVRHPAASTLPDLSSLLAARLPDAAHVCTATGTHGEIALQLLARGVHVLVEKPLAANVDETSRLLQVADAHAALVCPVYQFPFQRGFERAQQRLATMGRAIRAEITICSAGAERLSGGGDALVREVLPHPPSILAALFPDARADLASWHATRPGAGEFAASGRYGTVEASVYISAHALPPRCEARLFCDSCTLLLDFFHGYIAVQPDRRGRYGKIIQPFAAALGQSVAAAGNLSQRLLEREPAYPGLRRLIAAFYTSVRNSQPAPVRRETIVAVAQWCDHIERELACDGSR